MDTTFISSVIVRLLGSSAPPAQTWGRLNELAEIVSAEVARDPAGTRSLAAVRVGQASVGDVLDLFAVVQRRFNADPLFREETRRLVVAAYADPTVAPLLPDPAPGV